MPNESGVSESVPKNASGDFKWTVMVLMADAVEGETDLTNEAEEDLREMAEGGNVPAALNIFVQRHRRDGATRQRIGYGDARPIDVDAESASDGSALLKFMKWAHREANHRPQDRLMLVLWGHSYHFVIGRTKTPTGVDGLDFAELAGILGEFTDYFGKKIDIVGFDACQVATVEMAYELRDVADYLLSSQIGIPLPGWPYHRIFGRIKKPQGDRRMGPAEFGSYIVRRYCETYRAEERTVTLTMLDLETATQLADKAETLARALAFALDDEADLIAEMLSRSQTLDDEPFVDVADFCLNLLRESRDLAVRKAAEELGDELLSPGPVFGGDSLKGIGRPFIVEHGRNASETARLHGVSLYAPHLAPDHGLEKGRDFYDKFAFVKKTVWGDIVRTFT